MSNVKSRSIIARLLAEENISVGVVNGQTAFFDLTNRFLGLPDYEGMSPSVYNMLVAHEISHALYTPVDGWLNFAAISKVHQGVLNIVEDARIEKLVQRKYPGLVSVFDRAYKELCEKDIFKIKDRDVGELSFIDRANLHFKARQYIDVPFNDREQEIIDRIATVETWDDVIELTKEILGDKTLYLSQNRAFLDLLDKIDKTGKLEEGSDPTDETPPSVTVELEESEDDPRGVYYNPLDENLDPKEPLDEAVESDETDGDSFWTQASFDAFVKSSYTSENSVVVHYPPAKIMDSAKKYSPATVEWLESVKRQIKVSYSDKYYFTRKYTTVLKDVKKDVALMTQEFKMRHNAASYSRGKVSKSGELNTNKLHSYKFDDDIFLKVFNAYKGKSHGLYILLDYSGSMGSIIRPIWKQLLTIMEFCRANNIPFKFVTFTGLAGNMTTVMKDQIGIQYYGTRIQELVSSEMSAQELNYWKDLFICYSTFNRLKTLNGSMGGTPLAQAMAGIGEDVLKFRQRSKVEIMNLIVITDGDGEIPSLTVPMVYKQRPSEKGGFYILEGILGRFKVPFISRDNIMKNLADLYRANGIKVFNFHLSNIWYIKGHFPEYKSMSTEEFNKYADKITLKGCASTTNHAIYDKQTVLLLSDYKGTGSIWDKDSYEDTFMANTFNKKKNKILATEMIDMVL